MTTDAPDTADLFPPKGPFTTIPFEVPEMQNLNIVTLNLVAEMAQGMTKEEIFESFSCEADDLEDHELAWFDKFYYYGRGAAVSQVIKNLIETSRKNPAAGVTFLRRQSKVFEGDLADGDATETFSFTFGSKAGSVPDLKVIK